MDSSQSSGTACTLPLLSFMPPLACKLALCQQLCRTKSEGCCQRNLRNLQQTKSRLFLTLNRVRRTAPGDMSPLCISSERCLLPSLVLPCISALPAVLLKLMHSEGFPEFRLCPWWPLASSVSTLQRVTFFFLWVTDAAAGALCSLKITGAGITTSSGFWLLWLHTCGL